MCFLKGDPMHGYWDEDTTKDRCILRCDAGYEPSGWHVIRYMYRKWKWNHDIPSCRKGKDMSLCANAEKYYSSYTAKSKQTTSPKRFFSVGYKQYGTCIGTVKLHVILYMFR